MKVNGNKANIYSQVQPMYIYIYILKINIFIYVYTEITISKFDFIVLKPLKLIEGSVHSLAPEMQCTRLTYI
jgi:hypothetical protein